MTTEMKIHRMTFFLFLYLLFPPCKRGTIRIIIEWLSHKLPLHHFPAKLGKYGHFDSFLQKSSAFIEKRKINHIFFQLVNNIITNFKYLLLKLVSKISQKNPESIFESRHSIIFILFNSDYIYGVILNKAWLKDKAKQVCKSMKNLKNILLQV